MRKILWSPAGLVDVNRMAPRVRKADLREWRTVTGDRDFMTRLNGARMISRVCYVGRDDADPRSRPFVIYGVVDLPGETGWGAIWLVATPTVSRFKASLYEDAPERIQWVHDQGWYPKGLHNVVDSRNPTHVKWLKKVGATFPKGGDRMINGYLFHYFRFENPCVNP